MDKSKRVPRLEKRKRRKVFGLTRDAHCRFTKKHGEGNVGQTTPEYKTWVALRSRCLSNTNRSYPQYGGRGITVCARWNSYENFLHDMGRKPSPRHSIDRIDNNGNYEPSNCKWSTKKEQASNRRNSHFVLVNNKKMTVSEFARSMKINPQTLEARLKKGWTVERIMNTPVTDFYYAFNLKKGSEVYKNKTPPEAAKIIGISNAMAYLLKDAGKKLYKGFEIEYVKIPRR